jgi:WD40 repeat protein
MYGVAFAPTGDLLAVKGVENRVFVLPPMLEHATQDVSQIRQVFGKKSSSYKSFSFTATGDYHGEVQFAFSPDGKRLVVGAERDVVVIDAHRVDGMVNTLEGHTYAVDGALFHPDGRRVISYSRFDSLCTWDSQDGTLLRRLAMPSSLGFQGIDSALDPAVRERSQQVDRVTTRLEDLGLEQVSDAHFNGIAVSANGTSVFAAIDCLVVESYRRHSVIELDAESLTLKSEIAFPGFVRTIAVSADGRWLACGGFIGRIDEGRGLVSLVDLSVGKIVLQREGEFGLVTSVAFDPRGGRLAFSSQETEVLVWQFADELKGDRR